MFLPLITALLALESVNGEGAYPNTAAYGNPAGGNYYSYPSPGFSVQSGYEGYLVPTGDSSGLINLLNTPGIADTKLNAEEAAAGAGLLGLLPLLPLGLKLHFKFGFFVLGALFLLFVGGAATTALCSFTPLCSISFPFLRRREFQSLFTTDRLNDLAQFVAKAVDKYNKIQKKTINSNSINEEENGEEVKEDEKKVEEEISSNDIDQTVL